MTTLSTTQVNQFYRDGYLYLENANPANKLLTWQLEFQQWVEESRNCDQPYGVTIDNRPRFDIEPGHCPDKPALRGISSAIDISDTYLDVMHTRLLHGSARNLSQNPRAIFLCEYTAEDACPLQTIHIPSEYRYEIVRGECSHRVGCSDCAMKFSEVPTGASFFEQQAKVIN